MKSFDFGQHMAPMVEIIKPYDRKRPVDSQKSFEEVYCDLVNNISSQKVFVDLPLYLKERGSMKGETLSFSRGIISSLEKRTEHLLMFTELSNKVIPVINSFLHKTGEVGTFETQVNALRPKFGSIGFRSLYSHFLIDWPEISALATPSDFIILDLDVISPYPSPQLKPIIEDWRGFDVCPKVVLRSATNTEISNVGLDHGKVVYDVDNGLVETYHSLLHANLFADYVGIKKDDLTSGGTISPGFLFYDAVKNHFLGFKGNVKRLEEFADTIVPDVMASEAVNNMRTSGRGYLTDNPGWDTLVRISNGEETGKSQAKFKRIAMEHYLHCRKVDLEAQQP